MTLPAAIAVGFIVWLITQPIGGEPYSPMWGVIWLLRAAAWTWLGCNVKSK
jgi:hypothetical protein